MKERPILFSAPMVRALLAGTKTQTRRIVKPQPTHEALGLLGHPKLAGHFAPHVFGYCFAKMVPSPYGVPGDRLWVRETWALRSLDANKYLYGPLASLGIRAYGGAPLVPGCELRVGTGDAMVAYAAHPTSLDELRRSPGFTAYRSDTPSRWRPSIHMPRWASRITLDVTGVRVERLHDISEADAQAEGVEPRVTTRKVYPSKHAADVESRSHVGGFADLWREINGAESWDANPWVWVVEFKAP